MLLQIYRKIYFLQNVRIWGYGSKNNGMGWVMVKVKTGDGLVLSIGSGKGCVSGQSLAQRDMVNVKEVNRVRLATTFDSVEIKMPMPTGMVSG